MAASKKFKAKDLVTKMIICVAAGLGTCFILSIVTALAATKTGNALSLGTAIATLCVFGGVFTSTALGIKLNGKAVYGVYTGFLLALLLILFSLIIGSGKSYPIQLFSATALGIGLGSLIFGRQRVNAKKKLKKYIKSK